jgi:MYXO-CTERM domain-containing protein
MRRRLISLVAAAGLLTLSGTASAGATLKTGLGGTVGYGPSCMPPCDDGFWPDNLIGLDLTAAFPSGLHFYDGTYTNGWVNNNGSLSFKHGISKYTPDAFPGAPQPMIAPYWGDVDTRRFGDTWAVDGGMSGMDSCLNYPSGGTFPLGDTCHFPMTDGVWWSITPGQFVVTWDHVGVFNCQWKLGTPGIEMTFQMILTAITCDTTSDGGMTGTDFDIEFRYAECGWEAGIASGGVKGGFCLGGPDAGVTPPMCTPAQAGFDSAEIPDKNFASLPKSRMSGISTELCTQSNVNPPEPGVWRFSVRGGVIQCATAGEPCMTGLKGVCAAGQISCDVGGSTTCVPLTPAGPTICNGLDNNCDGIIDTGPCPAGTTCDGTTCVPSCTEGGGCPAGETCSAGLCIETDCVGVTCTGGQRCVGGKCVDDCYGVKCPIGQACRTGNCVDPCKGLACGLGQVCENGACVTACPCPACPSTQVCEVKGPLTGQCIDADCAKIKCSKGDVCRAGECISACTGAVCPMGQMCTMGECITPPYDGGGGFHPPPKDAGSPHDASIDASKDSGGDGFGPPASSGGCGCGTTRTSEGGWLVGMGAGVAFMIVRRRRRSRSRDRSRD